MDCLLYTSKSHSTQTDTAGAELYQQCEMGPDGKKPYDRAGSIPVYSEMQHGFRHQHGGDCADDPAFDL